VAPAPSYPGLSNDLEKSLKYGNMTPPSDIKPTLMLDYLSAGVRLAGNLPVLFVNEPMFIASGKNSDLRYNSTYPRWVYDQYRQIISDLAAANQWNYVDLWNAIPPQDFSDNDLHLTAGGEHLLAEKLQPAIRQTACR
jgi:lysophospholipase L1-like esterase